ncbi:hypothetical protein CICLE_v10010724mg [Citrus x clementina]|uniref:RING-type domain-containing protein n=1 Tax=Citrus clementina TaxID=85681 RepID=V4WJC1_CITCL|nr:hypothetical protein CICLE_v10010724mg [Citrus x clementina]
MVSFKDEKARATSTRVFRWNEKMLTRSKHLLRLGLLTLTTENFITKRFPGKSDVVEEPPIRSFFIGSNIWLPLFCHYRFPCRSKSPDPDIERPPLSPLTVTAVHVQRTRLVEFAPADHYNINNVNDCLILYPEPLSSSDECYSDCEPDIWKGKTDTKLNYSPDLIALVDLMKRYLGVRNKIPTQPIVIDEPVGLVEVKPEPGLEMFVFRGDEMLENKSCQICLQGISDGMEAVRAACKHIFHGICVSQWLSKEDSCPVCRFLLLKLA